MRMHWAVVLVPLLLFAFHHFPPFDFPHFPPTYSSTCFGERKAQQIESENYAKTVARRKMLGHINWQHHARTHINIFFCLFVCVFAACVRVWMGVSAHTYTRVSSEVKFMVPIKCISCFLNFYLHFYALHNNNNGSRVKVHRTACPPPFLLAHPHRPVLNYLPWLSLFLVYSTSLRFTRHIKHFAVTPALRATCIISQGYTGEKKYTIMV